MLFLYLFQLVIDSLIECFMLSALWHGVLCFCIKIKWTIQGRPHRYNPKLNSICHCPKLSSYIIFSCFCSSSIDFFFHLSFMTLYYTQSFLHRPPTPFHLLFNFSLMRYLILLVLFQIWRLNSMYRSPIVSSASNQGSDLYFYNNTSVCKNVLPPYYWKLAIN